MHLSSKKMKETDLCTLDDVNLLGDHNYEKYF